VLAGAPIVGTYVPDDGKFSESWNGPPYRDGVLGNTIHAWDDQAGVEWIVSCPSIGSSPTVISDLRDGNGAGAVTYSTDYVNGTLWLTRFGPWGDGTEDYTSDVVSFNVVSTHMFADWNTRLWVRSNVTMICDVRGYDNCLEYSIANVAIEGSTDYFPMPGGFPPFLDPTNCTTGVLTQGAWGPATQVGLTILGDCTVPTDDSTWGQIKALYE